MKLKFLIITLFISFQLLAQKPNNPSGFTENKGQIIDQKGRKNKAVLYLLNTNGLNVQLRKNGFSYDVYETKKHPLTQKQREQSRLSTLMSRDTLKTPNYTLEYIYHRIDVDFEGSNSNVKLVAEGKSADYDNYYNIPNEPNGVLDVHKFQKVTYQNIYQNIDVVFTIPEDKSKPVEYNFVIKPSGKISDIQLKFKGAKTELINNKIKMAVRFGQMEESLPKSWIENGSNKKEIAIGYKQLKKNIYGFDSTENLAGKRVVIDPVPTRLWGTFYGGENWSWFADLDTDKNGNICFSGIISKASSIYASSGAHQTTSGNNSIWADDGIIAKFNSTGTRIWGTYYGGNDRDFIGGIKTDSKNNIIITGTTYSETNISTAGSYKPIKSPVANMGHNTDSFIAKFDSSGVRLWGTYFGDTGEDSSSDIDIDNNDNIYIVGGTNSDSGISINNNFQTSLNKEGNAVGSSDAFLSKFNSNGNIIWSTYAGGEEDDNFNTIRVTSNFLVVGGESRSLKHISTPGVFQDKHYNANDNNYFPDGTVYQFTLNGKRNWSTYYGGEASTDDINTIEVDDENNIYIGGYTYSTNNIATPGSFDSSTPENQGTGFYAKLNSSGQRIWGSYLGNNSLVNSIKFKNNSIYICGWTDSWADNTSLTTPCAYRRKGPYNGYLGKFSKNCELVFGTVISGYYELGQLNINGIYGLRRTNTISFDNNNDIIVGGDANENNGIADSNSYQPVNNGETNFYLLKFSETKANYDIGSNSPLCIGKNLNLTASGGTNYAWTGPNGFTSNQQNPTISNINTSHTGKYSCVISETADCINTVTVDVIVDDTTKPVPDVLNLPTINRDCQAFISTIPTAMDNCVGKITATTTDPLIYSVPGTYTIHWIYDDGNGNKETQTQNVILTGTDLPQTNSIYYLCPNDTKQLSDINITGQTIKWYNASTGGNILPSTSPLLNDINYYASQTINGCESLRVPVTVNIQNTQAPSGDANQTFCTAANPTVKDIMVNGTNIIWYDSATGTNILPNTTLLVNGNTYYASQTVNGCECIGRLAVKTSLISTLNAKNYSELVCDNMNDGHENVNLIDYNSKLIDNSAAYTFEYYNSQSAAQNQTASEQITQPTNYNLTSNSKTFYIRIMSNMGCSQVVSLTLSQIDTPVIGISDTISFCEKDNVVVNAGAGFDSYLWSTGATGQQIKISQAGNYSVTVTQKYDDVVCSTQKDFALVASNVATISNIETKDFTETENAIAINVKGLGEYEYSLDGIHFQDENEFSGLKNGLYTAYVRDKNGCGTVTQEVYLLMYPKFFTPNGDSYNDTWKIKFSYFEPELKVVIYDRFGKLLKQLIRTDDYWDGKYNGNDLPSDDYWFVISRKDRSEYKGHFSLKR